MKNSISVILLFLSISLLSQEKEIETIMLLDNYIFTSSFQTDSITDFYGKKILPERKIHKAGRIFKIVNIKDDFVIIQYWDWKENKQAEKLKNAVLNNSFYKDGVLKYFVIKKNDFHKIAVKYYNRTLPVTAGIYSVPFKIRLNEFDFEQNLNFGVSIGFPIRTNRKLEENWVIEPNFGIGISKINLNKKNTGGTVDTIRTANAFTLSGGLLMRFSEKINFGTFIGFDLLGKADADTNWQYDKKLWIGLGVNISLNISKEKTEENGNNKGKD